MAFQVSAGVQVKEIDLTNVVPAVSTSIGALVGDFSAGPIGEVTTVSSETDMVAKFGQPTTANFTPFFQAAAFLKYGNSLRIVRAAKALQVNATGSGTGLLIKNLSHYEDNFKAGEASVGVWAARATGTIGNGIKVEVCPASDAAWAVWTGSAARYDKEFDSKPTSSAYAVARGGSLDEMHIIVIDTLGTISGTPGNVLEKFAYVSAASDAKKTDGTSNYYIEVIASTSEYIYWLDHTTAVDAGTTSITDFTAGSTTEVTTLSGGVEGSAATAGELSIALDMFADAETVDINLLIAPVDVNGVTTLGAKVITLVEGRKDCVAFISPPIADTVNAATPAANVLGYFNALASTSYSVADSTAVKIYDKYNDLYRWIPANGHTAGLCAYTDGVADAWFSPAGFNRGQILNTVKIAYNPTKAERDDLYKGRVNPIVSFPGEGTILYGDKTMLARPSAFDRINVRRLFIVLEKAVATASKFQLFELNDEFTRAQFRNMVEPFLRDIKGRRGLTDFKVVCDTTNNTGQVIDTNNFVADIYIKPARSINFITLNFIATRTGVEFSEIAGQ